MRRSIKNIACFTLYLCCYFALTIFAQADAIVDLEYARYQGVQYQDPINHKNYTQFLGIRYGDAPTGSRRFRGPQPPSYTPGVQLANKQPSECFQASSGTAPESPFHNISSTRPAPSRRLEARTPRVDLSMRESSEDCLFLNVHIPGGWGKNNNLPVVVWIHGGGYVLGNAALYNGNHLIDAAGGGVVSVVIQYRLGLFGFLPGEKVKEGGTLNAGLLDQQAALQWVQRHISKFGGDPNRVTVWGESAGAGSVLQHIVANDGNTIPPLFRAVITSSTFFPTQYNYNDPIPEFLYSEVVRQTSCASARDALECLRFVDVDSLQSANSEINNSGFYGTFVFVPVVDGSYITKHPIELLKAGKVNGDILLSLNDAFEGTTFVDPNTGDTVQVAEYVSELFPVFSVEQSNAVAAQYAGLGTNLFQVEAIMGESIFICPTYFLLRAFGGQAYKCEYVVPPAIHGIELFLHFPGYQPFSAPNAPSKSDPSWDFLNSATQIPLRLPSALSEHGINNPNEIFAKYLTQVFLNFVMTLNPNMKWDPSNITPYWGLWNETTEMLFNTTEGGDPDIRSVTTSSALLKRCEYWESVFSTQ